jgi:hypothetical protein
MELHYKPNSSLVDMSASKEDMRNNQFGFVANDLDPEPYTFAKRPMRSLLATGFHLQSNNRWRGFRRR